MSRTKRSHNFEDTMRSTVSYKRKQRHDILREYDQYS